MSATSPLLGGAVEIHVKPKRQRSSQKLLIASSPIPEGGETPGEPTEEERNIEGAKHAKVNATRDWVEGRISTEKHDKIHARANHVIKHGGRKPGAR